MRELNFQTTPPFKLGSNRMDNEGMVQRDPKLTSCREFATCSDKLPSYYTFFLIGLIFIKYCLNVCPPPSPDGLLSIP